MDQRPQHNASHTEPRREMESTVELIGTGHHFLNITLGTLPLRETINKWDLLELKISVKYQSTRQNDSL